ncbi:hypothetical protein M5W68_11855 [Paenibacillus larvae]|uniref:hypothetical protein n=1 Tax=Paenibacillus larvae TaxID=1464 RepID=UPI002282A1B7|nr:hypothetical protein [Paenibacillus larvae]MCY9511070.1 hypothetical protein [Paenibacillus larvae]MCY9525798.1 hypothetical protein [Paenibacillus larvae]
MLIQIAGTVFSEAGLQVWLLDEVYIGGDGSRIAPDVEAAISKAYPEVHQTSRD